jgi:hypothetical protein
MNIDKFRNAVIAGQIATLTAQIQVWQIYSERTGENVTGILTTLTAAITALTLLIKA